jgi:hypothetical protein
MRHQVRSWERLVQRCMIGALAVLMLAAGVYATGDASAAGFSKRSLKGTYTFSGGGVGLYAQPGQPSAGPVFMSVVGYTVYDGDGHGHGMATVSNTPMNSVPTPGPHRAAGEKANPVQTTCTSKATSTYEVNADGTGTENITTDPTDKDKCGVLNLTASFVLSSGGRDMHTIITGIKVPDTSHGVFASLVADSDGVRQ